MYLIFRTVFLLSFNLMKEQDLLLYIYININVYVFIPYVCVFLSGW